MSAGEIELSNDEYTCLMIANETNTPILAIGRWKQPCEHLCVVGLLKPAGSVECLITPAGRAALATESETRDRALREKMEELRGLRAGGAAPREAGVIEGEFRDLGDENGD